MATKAIYKHSNFCISNTYLKNELGEPQFLLLERDYQAKIKLSVKVKEFFGAELRQPLRMDNFKVDLTRDLQRFRGKFGIFHF